MKHLKSFNENTDNFKEELQDFCEMNLVYLVDEELEVRIIPVVGGVRLLIELNQNPQLWNDIKDHMIPFLTRLVSKYKIRPYANNRGKDVEIEVTRDIEAARQNWPHRISPIYYEVKKLINDDMDSGMYFERPNNDLYWNYNKKADKKAKEETRKGEDVLSSYIVGFEFIIDGYKQPKKSILTKIKSFFK